MKKIIIGVYTSPAEKYGDRRTRCVSHWLRAVGRCPGMEWYFVYGGRDQGVNVESNALFLPCREEYARLPQKTREYCRWALTRPDWDYIFKCDDDTYVDLPGLMTFVEGFTGDYAGGQYSNYASGGGGYLLSRRAAQEVVNRVTAEIGDEDMLTGQALRAAGIEVHNDNGFNGFTVVSKRWPSRDGKIFTAHGITAEMWENLCYRATAAPASMSWWMPTCTKYQPAAVVSQALFNKYASGFGTLRVTDAGAECFHMHAIEALKAMTDDLVLLMLDDYGLCGTVDHRAIAMACDLMLNNPEIASFATTWQPGDNGTKYKNLWWCNDLPRWGYTFNLQATIWRRSALLELLESIPRQSSIWQLELDGTNFINNLRPTWKTTQWGWDRPADASGHVDGMSLDTKRKWITPYHNLVHAGRPDPRHAEFLRGEGLSLSM